MEEVFTPLDSNGNRLRFLKSEVNWVTGGSRSGKGKHGEIEINGQTYEVYGVACGLDCYCDAKIIPKNHQGEKDDKETIHPTS